MAALPPSLADPWSNPSRTSPRAAASTSSSGSRRRSRPSAASTSSTGRATPATTARCSPSRAGRRVSDALEQLVAGRSARSTWTSTGASTPDRRGGRDPVRAARRHDDGRGVELAGAFGGGSRTVRAAGLPLRPGGPRGDRVKLADVRRGQYEGLKVEIGENGREPDLGPARMHPSAGAVAVGARPFLIAYNINLDSDDVELAKRIARRVRESGGGLPKVQANGFFDRGAAAAAQVSMNLLDFRVTPLWRVWETVRGGGRRGRRRAGRVGADRARAARRVPGRRGSRRRARRTAPSRIASPPPPSSSACATSAAAGARAPAGGGPRQAAHGAPASVVSLPGHRGRPAPTAGRRDCSSSGRPRSSTMAGGAAGRRDAGRHRSVSAAAVGGRASRRSGRRDLGGPDPRRRRARSVEAARARGHALGRFARLDAAGGRSRPGWSTPTRTSSSPGAARASSSCASGARATSRSSPPVAGSSRRSRRPARDRRRARRPRPALARRDARPRRHDDRGEVRLRPRLATELRLLEVAHQLGAEGPIEVVPTWLGAHAVPPEFRDRPDGTEAYVRYLIEEQLPGVAAQGRARSATSSASTGVFTAEQSRRILTAAAGYGLRPRLHADELAPSGGAELAAEIGAASADHLATPSEAGIAAMAAAAADGRAGRRDPPAGDDVVPDEGPPRAGPDVHRSRRAGRDRDGLQSRHVPDARACRWR